MPADAHSHVESRSTFSLAACALAPGAASSRAPSNAVAFGAIVHPIFILFCKLGRGRLSGGLRVGERRG